jgi:hypothetical protein
MTDKKRPPKWLPVVLAMAAAFIAAATGWRALVNRVPIEWYRWGFALAFGVAAVLAWRNVRKGNTDE